MTAAEASGGVEDIGQDPNFKRLADRKTGAEEFHSLLEEHVYGYVQKQRLLEGLKGLIPSVEAAETKQIVMKSVGKAKQRLEVAEQFLCDTYRLDDLREKVQALNAGLQASIDEGRITIEDKPRILEQLQTRLSAAEADGKEKLKQKLERNIAAVNEAAPFAVPVPDCEAISALKKKLRAVALLEKKAPDTLTDFERQKIYEKAEVKDNILELEAKSRMWFETPHEFKHRLDQALVIMADQKLEQKRLEAKEAPKAAPQPKKKEKPKKTKLDPNELFDVHKLSVARDADEEHPTAEDASAPASAAEPPQDKAPHEPAVEVEQEEPGCDDSSGPQAPEAIDASSEAAVTVEPSPEQQDPPSEKSAPQPAAKSKPAKEKVSAPPPKKREKKKFTKVDANTLGFEVAL